MAGFAREPSDSQIDGECGLAAKRQTAGARSEVVVFVNGSER